MSAWSIGFIPNYLYLSNGSSNKEDIGISKM
jgi:hypothetical protein